MNFLPEKLSAKTSLCIKLTEDDVLADIEMDKTMVEVRPRALPPPALLEEADCGRNAAVRR